MVHSASSFFATRFAEELKHLRKRGRPRSAASTFIFLPFHPVSAIGPKRISLVAPHMSAFSNRPVWVKRFQTIHQYSVDVARRLSLLFGIGTKALP